MSYLAMLGEVRVKVKISCIRKKTEWSENEVKLNINILNI